MTLEQPVAQELRFVSPSSYETLVACPLRLAFSQGASAGGRVSDAARIGRICHSVLESLAKDRRLTDPEWRPEVGNRFDQLMRSEEARLGRQLRGGRLARAKLMKVAARLNQLLSGLTAPAETLTEVELEAAEGRLRGRLDLIVRSEMAHFVADYKTGRITEAGRDDLIQRYRRQLMLYACLEAEAYDWPRSATIVPFGGEPVEVDVRPEDCRRLLEAVLSALEEWQDWQGKSPPARPGADTCASCPYAPRCSSFWGTSDLVWADDLLAARGVIGHVSRSPLGGTTIGLRSQQGSVRGDVNVRNIDVAEHPSLASASAGDTVALVGLRADRNEGAYTMKAGARSRLG